MGIIAAPNRSTLFCTLSTVGPARADAVIRRSEETNAVAPLRTGSFGYSDIVHCFRVAAKPFKW